MILRLACGGFSSLLLPVTDWENRWQAGDTGWDHGEPSPALIEYLESNPLAGHVLVPGCGSGHDVRAVARGGAEVLGLDIAPSALRKAREFPSVGKESYACGDWLDLDPGYYGRFDWVVEHTCFCAIAPSMRPAYVESLRSALRVGGHFLAVFYLNPRSPDGPPFGVTEEALDGLFGALTLKQKWTPSRAYPGREAREQMRLYVNSSKRA